MALKKNLKALEANPVQTTELITVLEEKDELLEWLRQFTLRAQHDQENIQYLEGQVESLQPEALSVVSIVQIAEERLVGAVSHMSVSENVEIGRLKGVLIQRMEEIQALQAINKLLTEMFESAARKEEGLLAEVAELKKKNIQRSTLKGSYHSI